MSLHNNAASAAQVWQLPQKEVSVTTATHELPTSGGQKFLEVLVQTLQVVGAFISLLLYCGATLVIWNAIEAYNVNGAASTMILQVTLLIMMLLLLITMLLSTVFLPTQPNYRSLRWICSIVSVVSVITIIACSRFTADEWTAWVNVTGHDVGVVAQPGDSFWVTPGGENLRVFEVANKEPLVIETQGMTIDHRTVTLGLRGRLTFQPNLADLSPLRELTQVERSPAEHQREVPAILARLLLQEATVNVLATRTSVEVLDPALDTADTVTFWVRGRWIFELRYGNIC